MPSSSNIIKRMENAGEPRVLELRHVFMRREEEENEGAGEAPQADPALEAARIIGEAGERAEKIIADAKSLALQIEKEATDRMEAESAIAMHQAREQGFAEGRKEALARAAAEASAIREQARSVLRQAEEIRRQTLESLQPEIVRLAVEISEKLLVAHLDLNTQTVADIAGEAISMLHNREQVVLFVNPGHYEMIQGRREDLLKLLSPKGELHIISDPEIAPGGCVAETEHGRVDARLEKRWESLLNALEEFIR
ncbi:MAG: FliH/SctL family protein [Bacillota bacterium]